ncbi:YrhB domain-containing protein [Streptomyces sp. NPDC055189]
MVDREYAVRLVEAQLARESPEQSFATYVEEHELVWIVSYQSAEYARTGDFSQMLVGNETYLVDRVDGGLHWTGVLSLVSGEWEADYRTRIRGITTRTAVDDLHDELRQATATRGRMAAMRLLRQKVPALAYAEVVAYVSALHSGAAPARLAAVATETLAPAPDPVVHTIQPGQPTTG